MFNIWIGGIRSTDQSAITDYNSNVILIITGVWIETKQFKIFLTVQYVRIRICIICISSICTLVYVMIVSVTSRHRITGGLI